MKLRRLFLGLSCLLLASCNIAVEDGANVVDYADKKVEGNSQFDFDGNYTPPELKIDGIKDDEQWNNASETINFGSNNQASMTIYRGNEALFCFFEVKDNDIQTIGFNNGDDVTNGDSVEVYFDFKNDASNKPQNDDIQINIGAHGKTRIFVGSNGEWGSWNGLLDYEISLNGTLNDSSDIDNGYNVELMVPYSQIGIDKNSTYGIAVGHVARGKDSTHETLQYTWGGLVFEGSFVDPQVPKNYIVFMGNKFYSRNNTPLGMVNLRGTVVDELGNPIEGAQIKVNESTTQTNSLGKYELVIDDANSINTIIVSKNGYREYSYTPSKNDLRTESGNVDINLCLISNESTKNITITGVVKNPVEGNVADVDVTIAGKKAKTNENGEFSISCTLDYSIELEVAKEPYKSNTIILNAIDLIGKESYELGAVSLFSPSSSTSFGGARGIPQVNVEIYRGFEGIHFMFSSKSNIVNGDHVELFIDSGNSFYGRDTSDYRIDFRGDGTISIVNFGDGSNTVVSASGIKNNAYLEGTSYYMDTMVPYSFLGINQNDIIGISLGVWSESLSDWDGWTFVGAGFEDYVAPEYSDQYCRIGLDNSLYRALSNNFEGKICGKILDKSGNPITTALVNRALVKPDGTYEIYLDSKKEIKITVEATGYISQTITIDENQLAAGIINHNFELAQAFATITGTCNVEGAKVYLESDPTIFAFVENGKYTILIPSNTNAKLIFEAEGYNSRTIAIGLAALLESANNNVPINRDVTLNA